MGLNRTSSISLLLLIPMALAMGTAAGDVCEDCHSSSGSSGGYDFEPPLVVLSQPAVCGPGEKVMIRLYMISTSVYEVRSMKAELISGGGTERIQGKPGMDPEGQGCIEWELTSGTGPAQRFTADCECICYYRHGSPGNKDTGLHTTTVRTDLPVADSNMRIDRDLVFVPEAGSSVTLRALGPISGISLDISPSLLGKVDVSLDGKELSSGETIYIALSPMSRDALDGHINVSWTESGARRHAYIRVLKVLPTPADGIDLYHEIGKYTGIAAFIILVVGYFTGGTGPLKRWGNKMFKTAPRRIKFHCALSYEVMILVIFHMLVLWYGPYRELIWLWEVVLGEVALLIMLVIALNGILQKRLIPLMGYQNWRRVHAWGTYLATGLVVVHMLTNGTHFLWFRQLIGMV
ncbi:MAG: hypothetical protein MUC62_05155 [Candidatus Thermoplasmatota archaeon]|nr:hypothetical protein [Candidatus Thermoplasmatota archaeon]